MRTGVAQQGASRFAGRAELRFERFEMERSVMTRPSFATLLTPNMRYELIAGFTCTEITY